MAKHLNRSQIMQLMREQSKKRKESVDAAFTGIATISLYVFYKNERWSVERMQTYLARVMEYLDLIKEYGNEELDLLKKRYTDEAFDKPKWIDETVTIKTKGNPLWFFEKANIETDNLIVQKFDEYMLAHLNTLMDMNVNPKRIQMNRKEIARFIEEELDKISIYDIRRILFDETGFAVKMPGQTDEEILNEFGYDENYENVTKY